MKKWIISGAIAATTVAAVRRFGPALHRWAMTKCQEMGDRMSEESPKRMIPRTEEIRDQDSGILHHYDEERTALAAAPEGR